MAQLSDDDILHKIVSGQVDARDGLLELIDRSEGSLTTAEGQLLDFKEKVHLNRADSVAELASG